MAELTPEIAAVVRAACETNADEAAGAFTRAIDAEISLTVGSEGVCDLEQLPDGFDGPGLVVLFKFGPIGVLGILPQSTGLLPTWYSEPDPTGQSKLTTLAQELSMLLVPDNFMADDFKSAKVDNLGNALNSAGVSSGAGYVPLTLTAGESSGTFHLIWPCLEPDAAFEATDGEASTEASDADPAESAQVSVTHPSGEKSTASQASVEDLDQLPPYTRSLLRIKVPVMVTLASKKQSIHQIIELGAGSIIKFDKSCDEMLDLEVGGMPIAKGEAVKVGDKFGLRINSMILPGERFKKLGQNQRKA